MRPVRCILSALAVALLFIPATAALGQQVPTRFPADKATEVNPDTHLVLTFASVPTVGKSGKIRIFDAADNRLVDTLDMSIPAGPVGATRGAATRGAGAGGAGGARGGGAATAPAATYTPVPYEYVSGHTNANTVAGTPSGVAVATPATYQLTIIGGFTDAFHFYPIIVHDKVATIYLHNNLLEYNKTYYVQMDPEVLAVEGGFAGISGADGWRITTKKAAPALGGGRLVVAGDGSGDFNTVQGAIDFIPDHAPQRTTVFIKNGSYEEIVYFRNKSNITILGEDRDKVQVFYANNEVFNPHPANVLTNEYPGTFPSRRAAFMVDHSTGIELVNFTVKTTLYGQAEGLLMAGGRNIVSNVSVVGSGDALQVNDPAYFIDSSIWGDGDTILGRGPAFFDHCELHSGGAFMWIRNTAASHGCVFLNCAFQGSRNPGPVLARAPVNSGRGYPNAEVVLLNCVLGNIDPAGWGPVGGETANIHYWEYNSISPADLKPVDVSKRHVVSKQLDKEKDAQTISNYSNPSFVLGGWEPAMVPLFLKEPEAGTASAGQSVMLSVKVAAIPVPTYQWFKNDVAISGATEATLKFGSVGPGDAGRYTVKISNSAGSVTSAAAALTVN